MEQSAKIIIKSTESDNVDPNKLRKDMTIIAGKAAGICYMPDNYLSDGIQNEDKALTRAKGTAKSGHYSTYEHGHVTFLINTSKMMAMILNSLNLYSTSEKSARYTNSTPETEIEKSMYTKWKGIFTKLINSYYEGVYNDKEIEKLAMENARYMLSVFTPTVLAYTVPYNRAVLTVQWLKNLSNTINYLINCSKDKSPYRRYDYFYRKLSEECFELSEIISAQIGVSDDDILLADHKNIGIEFIRTCRYISKLHYINDNHEDPYEDSKKHDLYGDVYISNYNASFTEIAQGERHRTLHYTIDLPYELKPYIPKIIRGSAYEIEWNNDFKKLIENKIVPQCTIVEVCEEGRFEDFVLKCKERLCSRAQLEIMEVTRNQVVMFASNYDNLCTMNQQMLDNMVRHDKGVNYKKPETVIVESRCKFKGYTCHEPCKILNDCINYYRNI